MLREGGSNYATGMAAVAVGCAFRGSWALISRDGGQRIQAMLGRQEPDRQRLLIESFSIGVKGALATDSTHTVSCEI
jgi:hypothetical protein